MGIHAEAFDKLRRKRENEHDYSASLRERPFTAPPSLNPESDSSSSHPEYSEEEDKPGPSKEKHSFSSKNPQVLTFKPTEMIHPRASN